MTRYNRLVLAAAAALVAAGALPASAQSGPDYFDGRTVAFVVATDVGGGFDTYGRLVAEFMQKHLPGSTFVVRNLPGAGHMIGANHIYAAEPDGLTIGTFNTGLVYNQLVGNPGVRFDLGEMSWIGKVASDPRVIVVSEQSGIASWDDLAGAGETVRFAGGVSVTSASAVEITMLISALGLPIQLITGYDGNEGELAMLRGEVQGLLASRSSLEPFVAAGNGRFVAQIGGSDTDVPQLDALVTHEAGLRAIALVESQSEIARLVVGPPGLAEDVLATLRDAFAAAVGDPDFLARAEALNIPVDPLVGEAVSAAIDQALDQSPELVDFLKGLLGE